MPHENDGVPPPKDEQKVKKLPGSTTITTNLKDAAEDRSGEAGRDAPPLPAGMQASLDDGIKDQESRRSHRAGLVTASLWVLTVLMVNLTIVVGVLTFAFCRALSPDSVAKASVAELVKWVDQSGSAVSVASPASGASQAASKAAVAPIKTQAQAMKIEAKIFGEVRDSMVPLVALVSILLLAVTVILGTMLRAAFARPVLSEAAAREEKDYHVPVLQAAKDLLDSIKAFFKS